MAELEKRQLEKLIQTIFDTHIDDMIDCESCEGQFCHLAELVAAGADLCELLPAMEAHLKCCPSCREEWDALLTIIKADQAGALND